jgi:hypothetical protein
VDFLKNLVVGMPTRIQEVIAREGGMTRYGIKLIVKKEIYVF